MAVSVAPSIFDVFNARQLTPEQVAKSFVPPSHFENLIKPTHALVVGPRGSGKTTLLKMLHPAALQTWHHPNAERYRQSIAFTGVFVATDINWNEQVKALGEGRLDAAAHRQFATAAFTTEILQSLVESMMYRSGRISAGQKTAPACVSAEDEAFISKELFASWHFDRGLNSFEGLHFALSRRLSQIRVLASQESHRDTRGRGDRIAEIRFLHLDFLAAAGVAVDLFNARALEQGRRWALLFDELELAPEWIRDTLMRYLRSVDELFLFKLSISPYSVDIKKAFQGADSVGAKQDFEPIRLWYEHKEHGYPFCRELLRNLQRAKGLQEADPDDLFGLSVFSTDPGEWAAGTAYRADSQLGKLYARLAAIDLSCAEYLERRGIRLDEMAQVDKDKRASDLRKARLVVAIREYFRGSNEAAPKRTQGRRSRKVPSIYGGASSLFAMMEGNPRWFIAIVGGLLARGMSSFTAPEQVRSVLEASYVFRSMLRTIPCGPVGQSNRGLLSLLDSIGTFFSRACIDGPFDPDPPCSFVVESTADDAQLKALGMALNAGAIVYAPGDEDPGILENLRGKRFRLSYILAPHYRIPLLLGRSMSLQQILKRSAAGEVIAPSLFRTFEEEL